MKKILFIPLFLFLITMNSVLAVECNSNLNNTPCDLSSSLTLSGGTYDSLDTISITSSGVILDGNGSLLNTNSSDYGVWVRNDSVEVKNLNVNISNVANKGVGVRKVDNSNTTNFQVSNVKITGLGNGVGIGLYTYRIKDSLIENINIYNFDVIAYNGVSLLTYQVINTTINNLYADSGYLQLYGVSEDDLIMNNLTTDTTGGDTSILWYGVTVNNSHIEASTDDDSASGDVCMTKGFYNANAINKIFNSELSCVDAGDGRMPFWTFDGVAGDNNIELKLSNVNITNIDFGFEHFPITQWDDVQTTNVSFEILDMPNYGGDSAVDAIMTFPSSSVFNIDLGLIIESQVVLIGQESKINGSTVLNGANVVINNTDFDGTVLLNNSGMSLVGNTFRGVVTDSVSGNSFCDYSSLTENFYIGGVYSGENVGYCADTTEFSLSTTNFSVVSNWSNVDLILENSLGKIDWVANKDLRATSVDFDTNVDIVQNSITVNSVGYPELNASASLTFKGVSASDLASIILKRDGVECTIECTNEAYDLSTNIFTVDVTKFSTYSLDYYEVQYETKDITGMVVDGGLGVVATWLSLAGVIALILVIWFVRGRLKKNLTKKK